MLMWKKHPESYPDPGCGTWTLRKIE